MDVGLSVFGWLNLDDKVHTWDVKASGSDVCGNQNAKFLLFKAFEGDFSLVLSDVTMHYFNVLFNLF